MNKSEILQVAKPILFNSEMVQALLDGRKSVTRRVIKVPNDYMLEPSVQEDYELFGAVNAYNPKYDDRLINVKPKYKTGDILYVRETWQNVFETEYDRKADGCCANIRSIILNFDNIPKICTGLSTEDSCASMKPRNKYYIYKASNIDFSDENNLRWRPSIHMPKEASRIFLKVTGVGVERIHDMYVDDAINEGAWGNNTPCLPFSMLYAEHPTASCNAIASFAHIWDSTVDKKDMDKYGWNVNPWVWVYEFERVNIDE